MKNLKPVLLIEDDQVDALTVKRAFKEIKVQNKVVHVENGEQGLEYLQSATSEQPCIILLDLNMPKMNGHEFLEVVKKNGKLKSIPVVVLTTSNEEKDRAKSFNNSVAGYLVKPVDYLHFVELLGTFKEYWNYNELP